MESESTASSPWLVVGLGNPGPVYAGNRHSVGFLVVDLLAQRWGGRFKRGRFRAEVAEERVVGLRCVLAKPQTYMNDSGAAVAGLRGFFKVPLDRVVVVHDELDLEYGQLRTKLGGGDNGHNGLKSVRTSLGSGEFYRVRFGIGRPPGRMSPHDYVLKDFARAERADLDFHVDRTADAVESLVRDGLERTQNIFNARPPIP